MGYLIGYQTMALVNDKVVSTRLSGWSATHRRPVSEVTTAGQTVGAGGASFVPGLMSGTLAIRGPQDNDPTASLHKKIADAIGVDNAFQATVLPDSDAVGKPAIFMVGDADAWAIDAAVHDALGFTFSATADESVDMGYVLHPIAAETVDVNGTAVDRGVVSTPSTLGLAAVMHITAYASLTSAAIKIQHSPDNSAWADLVSFVTATAVGAQRVSVAKGVTINRYLRVVTDVTGSGSVTFLVAAAPR